MNFGKGLIGLLATVGIAAVVAYGVSAPRNVDNVMNQDMAALGGQSINEHVAQAQAEANRQQCETFTRLAQEAWDRSVDQGTEDRDAETLDELDRKAAQFCER